MSDSNPQREGDERSGTKLRWRLNLEAIKDGLKTISSFPSHSRSTDKPCISTKGGFRGSPAVT